MSRPRGYGHHESDEFEALAEAESQDDGTISIRLVLIDKRPEPTEPDWYDTHCPTCDAPEPTHTPTCAVVHRPSDSHPVDCGDMYCERCGEDAPW